MGTVESSRTARIFFALAGAGASAMWTPVITVVQRWFGKKRRGMALGILSTGFGLGFATTGWLFPVLVSSFSWRFCWYVLGAWALIMVLVNGIFLRSGPEDLQMSPWGEEGDDLYLGSEGDLNGEGSVRDLCPTEEGRYGQIFRSARFWTIGASYFFIACALYIVTTFMVDYANVELGLGFKEAAFLATIHGLSQVVGVLTIPILSDRIGRRLTLMGSNVFIALGIMGVIASAKGIPILFASIALLGIFYGITWPMYGACGGDYFRKEVMGTVIGAWTPFYGLGAILAHFITGRIRDITQSFQPAFYLAILFALAAAFLMQRVKRPDGGN
jgi:sugar phosphate permease